MASITGVSSGNANSLYGNRNVISGLASGMDTESMIENAVSGIRMKISGLLQKQTKLSWKQEAYWGVTDKLVQFSRKYGSYTSATNLMSPSFFNKAVLTTAGGENASKISATGKTSSNVVIDGVAQLAAASRYQVKSGGVLNDVNVDPSGARFIQGDTEFKLDGKIETSNLQGALGLTYGSKSVVLQFESGDVYKNADEFAAAINKKLEDQTITTESGTAKASDKIKAEVKDGKITFSDKSGANNLVYITGTSGKLNETLGKPDYSGKDVSTIDLSSKSEADLKTVTTVMEQIAGKTMSFTLDGTTKKITLPTAEELAKYKTDKGLTAKTDEEALVSMLNDKLSTAFGPGKVEVSLGDMKNADGSANSNEVMGALQFTATKAGSNLVVTSDANEAMGMKMQETTYLNTSKTLEDFLGDKLNDDMALKAVGEKSEWKPVKGETDRFTDKAGNLVDQDGFRLDAKGNKLYSLTINGKQIGAYSKGTAMETIMVDINANAEAGVSVTYSKTTNQFVFTSSQTGAGRDISIGTDGVDASKDLGKMLFGEVDKTGDNYTEGKDAIIKMTINGTEITATRDSNTFDVDGLAITLKGTFNGSVDSAGAASFTDATEDVSFTTKADADKIVDAVKGFVTDYNEMVKTLRDSFATMPLKKTTSGGRYEPLTDSDMEGMSDSAIESYNEKVKTGLLFGDSDLSSLYSKLSAAIAPAGADGAALRNIGINTLYSGGLTTIDLDESALRTALENNPDSVRDAFSKTAGSGSTTDGLMVKMKESLDTYVATEGTKGVLITKAGSKYAAASLLQNSMKTQIDDYDSQVEKWQDKLSDKVDFYTSQFSRLEQLISQMNSQSSSLMQMMGGG